MANPFDGLNQPGNGIWNNLMNFGLATMAAANERDGNGLLKYGGGAAGPIGAGGLSAMNTARENKLAQAQVQDVQSQSQGRSLDNRLKLMNYNFMAPYYGMPALAADGTELGNLQASGSSNGGQVTPPTNTNGMSVSPTAGMSPQQPQYREGTPTPSATPTVSADRVRAVVMGDTPQSPEEAGQAAMMASKLGYGERAKALNDFALAGPIKRAEYFSTPQSYHEGETVIDPQTNKPIVGRTATGQPYYSGGSNGSGAAPAAGSKDVPLGIRNNNPLNMRPSADNWQGMTGQNGGYLTFDKPEDGVRAAAKNLLTYNQRGINTPTAITAAWAPAGDNNNPKQYAEMLAGQLGITPDTPINLADPYMNGATIRAMSYVENGGHYLPNGVIATGVQSAFGMTPNSGAAPAAAPMQARQASFAPPQGGMQANSGVYQAPAQPPAAAPAQGDLPSGAVALGPNPLRQKDYEKQIDNFNSETEQKRYQAAQSMKQNMAAIVDDLKTLNDSKEDPFLSTGPGFEKRKDLANQINFAHRLMGGDGDLIPQDKVAAGEDLIKQNASGGMQAINEMFGASREAASIVQTGIKSFPGGELSPQGNQLLAQVVLEGANRITDLYDYKQAALQNGSYDLRQAEIDFNKKFPPESYTRRAISQMTPITVNKPAALDKLLPGTIVKLPNGETRTIQPPNGQQ